MGYRIVWDCGHTVDATDAYRKLARAKSEALEILAQWVVNYHCEGKRGANTRDAWDRMIEECSVAVYEDDAETPIWEPSEAELLRIGWMSSEDMPNNIYDAYATNFWWTPRTGRKPKLAKGVAK